MMVSKELLGLIFLPTGVMAICSAAVWQIYVVFTESYPLNRFKEWPLVGVITAMFFSFSLAIYLFCPNARKKGLIFTVLGGSGVWMYYLARLWLPWQL